MLRNARQPRIEHLHTFERLLEKKSKNVRIKINPADKLEHLMKVAVNLLAFR
jgi:hypothetical protein